MENSQDSKFDNNMNIQNIQNIHNKMNIQSNWYKDFLSSDSWKAASTKHLSFSKTFLILSLALWGAITPYFIMSRNLNNDGRNLFHSSLMMLSIFLLLFVFYVLINKNEKLKNQKNLIRKTNDMNVLITENISDMITIHDLEGRYIYLSPSCKGLLGYDPEELVGIDPYTLFNPSSISHVSDTHEKVLNSDEVNISCYQIQKKDGDYVWLESSNQLIYDTKTQKPKEILCVSRNVTHKKNEEEIFKKMIKFAENLLSNKQKQLQYMEILENLMYLSKAKIGIFTIKNDDTGIFTTQIVLGISETAMYISKILGFNVIGKEWPEYDTMNIRLQGAVVTRFESFTELSINALPLSIARNLESILGIGEGIVIKINANDQMIGDFTLLMPKGKDLENLEFIEIYSRQIDMYMSRIKTKETLIESEQRLLSAQNMANIGNWEINLATNKVWGSSEALRIYGINENQDHLDLEEIQKIVNPEYRDEMDKAYRDLIVKNLKYEQKFKITKKDSGEERFIHSNAILVCKYDGTPKLIKGTIQDITDFKKAELEVEFLSYHDQLTGLYNRRYYDISLARLDSIDNLPLTCVMGDLNGLKLVNDSFGHLMGDELLIKASNIIKNACRSKDIVARIGGDEFIILMPQTDSNKAEEIIADIKANAQKEKVGAVELSISFGYDTKTTESQNIQEVFKETEDKMYRHKLCESTSMRNKTIDLILNTLYEKNNREMMHSKRVGALSVLIARKMQKSKDFVNLIYAAGLMHDIGKIGIDEKILNKPNELLKKETKDIERHPEIGYRILTSVNELADIAECVLQHHERLDGTGYPRNLIGEQISLQARILSVADAYDAMICERTYRKTFTKQEAIEEMIRCKHTQFDPVIVEIFIEIVSNESLIDYSENFELNTI